MNIMQFAMDMIQKNPNIATNKRNQDMINVLRSVDAAKGEEVANNLLKTYSADKEQTLTQARQFFHL